MGQERREFRAKRDWDETRTRQGVSRLDPDPFFVHTTNYAFIFPPCSRTVREKKKQTTNSQALINYTDLIYLEHRYCMVEHINMGSSKTIKTIMTLKTGTWLS